MGAPVVDDLARVFQRRDAAGHRVYSPDEIRAYLFREFLAIGPAAFGDGAISAESILFVGEWSIRLGLRPGDSVDEMQAKVERYYEEHPIRGDLRIEIEQALRESARTSSSSNPARTLLAMDRATAPAAPRTGASPLSVRFTRGTPSR